MQRASSKAAKSSTAVLEADFLHSSLTHAELIKRLKVVTEKLESFGDDEEAVDLAKRELGQLSATLGEGWLVKHKNKDVMLLVSCALADILRIYAPDPPYEEATSAEVIKLFVKILRGFESPDMTPQNHSYSIHFYLLERLSNISIFSIIPELFNYRDELLLSLMRSSYDIVGNMVPHTGKAKVMEHMTSILCSVMEEMESYTLEMFDVVVGGLTQQQKKDNSSGYDMMKMVIANCPNHLQPFIERQLHQIKAGFQTESELTQGDRLSEAVFELGTIAPRVLTQVLPAYTDDLTLEDPSARIIAIKLLGALFSVGNFYKDFVAVFNEFKRRAADKDPDVRRAMVSVMQALVSKRPELGSVFMDEPWMALGETRDAPLRALLLDSDERVRKDALEAVVDLCSQNSDTVSSSLLQLRQEMQLIADRVKDKKIIVRHAALEGLSKLYRKYCAPFDRSTLSNTASEKFGWIPSRIVSLYYMDSESRVTVSRCVEELCLSPESSSRTPASVALDFWNSLDDGGKENMILMLRKRQTFSDNFLKLVQQRDKVSMDYEEESADAGDGDIIAKLSQHFSEPSKAASMIRKLFEIKAAKVWESLEELILKPQPAEEVSKIQADTLKRLGPKSQTLEAVKIVIGKISDSFFGVNFIQHILNVLKNSQEAEIEQAIEGVAIVPLLAEINPRLFWDQSQTIESLILSGKSGAQVLSPLLKTLAIASVSLEKLKTRKPLLKKLKDLCLHESWMVSKFSTRALLFLGGDSCDELQSVVKTSLSALSLDSGLPSALCCLSEAAKRSSDLFTTKDREKIVTFVRDNVLGGSWPATSNKKEKQLASDSRLHGIKLLTSLMLGQHGCTGQKEAAAAQAALNKLSVPIVDIFSKMAANDDEFWDRNTLKSDKAMMRLAAGSALIKIAKQKDLEHLVTPKVFLSMARLCEDEEASVRSNFYKKLYKGMARQHGKLPFRFASMFALAAHDVDGTDVEACKHYLKTTLGLMRTLQKTKNFVSLVPEHILPWLVFLVVCHPDYLDPDENSSQIVLAMKKYLEIYMHSFFITGHHEYNCLGLLQIFEHLKQCQVKDDAVPDTIDRKVIRRNVGLIAEMGHRLVKKMGESKRWATEGFTGSISKMVEGPLFVRSAGKVPSFSQVLPVDLGLSPVKAKSTPSKASAPASGDTPNKRRATAAAGRQPSKKAKTAEAEAPKPRGRPKKRPADWEDEDDEEEEERQVSKAGSRVRRSIATTIAKSVEDEEASPTPPDALVSKASPVALKGRRSASANDNDKDAEADDAKSTKPTPTMPNHNKGGKGTGKKEKEKAKENEREKEKKEKEREKERERKEKEEEEKEKEKERKEKEKEKEKVGKKTAAARPSSSTKAKRSSSISARQSTASAASAFDFDDGDDVSTPASASKATKGGASSSMRETAAQPAAAAAVSAKPSPGRGRKSASSAASAGSPATSRTAASSNAQGMSASTNVAAVPIKKAVPKGRASASHALMDDVKMSQGTQASQNADLWENAIKNLKASPTETQGIVKKRRKL